MARRRQQRRREKERRHAPSPVTPPSPMGGRADGPAERLYSRKQAAQALGISLATLDRRVIPAIATIKTEWGARLIPATEIDRYLAERTEEPRMPRRRPSRSGRKSTLPPDVIARIHRERADGSTFAEIARDLNCDGVATAQGGRQWWPSTIQTVVSRAG